MPNRRNSRYVAALAATAAAILAVGIWVRHVRGGTEPPAPSESDLLRLTQLTQRRSLEDLTVYFGSIAERAAAAVVWWPELDSSALAWSPDLMVGAGGHEFVDAAVVAGPHVPITAMRSRAGTEAAVRRTDPSLGSGEWIVAVWRNATGPAFQTATSSGTAPMTCGERTMQTVLSTLVLTTPMRGAGLFDLDGRLVALVVPCGETLIATSVSAIDEMLRTETTAEGRLVSAFGVRLTALTADEAQFLDQERGSIVREVWEGSSAARSDLRPGDVIRAIDGREWPTPVEVQAALLANDPDAVTLQVQRRSQAVVLTLQAPGATAPAGDRTSWQSSTEGFPIDDIGPGTFAGEAGLRPGDRVIRVDYVEPRSLADVRRRLASGQPALLEVERGRRRSVVLRP